MRAKHVHLISHLVFMLSLLICLVVSACSGAGAPPTQATRTHAGPATAITERTALERLAQASTVEATWFAPSLLAVEPLSEIQQFFDHARQELGPYQAVIPQPNQSYYVTYQRGLFRALIHIDPQNRIDQFLPSSPELSTDRVLVGGYHMYFRCQGNGTPTVLLEAGMGNDASVWEKVMPVVATSTRVCAYDRAGIGSSDARPGPRTSDVIAQQLHALLVQEGVPGPYILVGHSIAGFHMRLFADRYPREVAGMVMVDCSHPDQIARLLEVLGPKRPGEPASLTTIREVIADPSVPDEKLDFGTSAAQVRATGALLSIPLVVLTAGNHQFPKALEAAWRGMQEELADLSSESVHVLIPKSSHVIQEEYPQPVIAAVNKVVMAVRTHQRLASCTQTFPTLGGVCFPGL